LRSRECLAHSIIDNDATAIDGGVDDGTDIRVADANAADHGTQQPCRPRVFLFGDNSVPYVGIDHALITLALPSAPLQPTLDDTRVLAVLSSTTPACAIVQSPYLERFLRLLHKYPDDTSSIKLVLSYAIDPTCALNFDAANIANTCNVVEQLRELLPVDTLQVDSIERLLHEYDSNQQHNDQPPIRSFADIGVPMKPNDIVTLIHTSGSTGIPKGAIMSEASLRREMHGVWSYCTRVTIVPLSWP
jgi:long-subunit acyl-CoA synthetase (AMP-forming)